MLETRYSHHEIVDPTPGFQAAQALLPSWPPAGGLEELLEGMSLRRRHLRKKQYLFRAGQASHFLYLIHAGMFRTSVLSPDGREKITGFRMRGDLLGMDSLGMPNFACDAIALDACEVWELPYADLCARVPDFERFLAASLAREIRRDWSWMLAVSTLNAEQRVVAFLLDLSQRMSAMGFSPHRLLLRMSRGELGNFLSLQLETVARALSHLQSVGLIGVERREIRIDDPNGLRAMLGAIQ